MNAARTTLQPCCQTCLGTGLRLLYGRAADGQLRAHSRVPCEVCAGTGHDHPEGQTIPGGLYDTHLPTNVDERRAR